MISVAIIWIYIILITYGIGLLVNALFRKIWKYEIESMIGKQMAGLVVSGVYAQTYSLLGPVGLWANLILAVIAGVGLYTQRENIHTDLEKLKKQRGMLCYSIIAYVLLAYSASRGIIHYDTSLYHAQSIRWVEEYGIIKGLGNLHCRLAYNSAAFPLTALFSFHFLGGQSYHVVSGYIAWLLAVEAGKLSKAFKRKRMELSDYARLMAYYYLFIVFDEIISPASDYFMVLVAFYIVIRYLTLIEADKRKPEGYGILCLLGVFLLTIKLSAALIILLVLYPAVELIKEKKYVEILQFLGIGILIALPYLIRNIIISGWLIYPFTAIDICPVDWKIPKGLAQYDAKEIQVFGRGYTDVLQYDMPIQGWIGNWFKMQGGLDKIFILLACSAVIIWIILRIFQKRNWKTEMNLLVEGTCVSSFLFWLFTSPLFRYGCVYVWLAGVLVWANIAENLWSTTPRQWKTNCQKLFYVGILLFSTYKILMLGTEIKGSFTNNYWLHQKDYDTFATESYTVDQITIYKPVTGDQAGYDPFPSSPTKASIALRGPSLKDGLIPVE